MSDPAGIYKTLVIDAVVEEVEGFKTIVFKNGHGISYKSGQYLTLVRFENREEQRRSYSIISSPQLNEPLSIGVKRVANGVFSRWLVDRAKPGDEILTTGSGGFFMLPDDTISYNQLFFFAAGSGITPVYSLLKTALYAYPHLSLVLVYSNASAGKTIFLKDLQHLQEQFPKQLKIHFLFSNAADLSRARLNRDLLLSLLAQYGVSTNDQRLFYVCGPESYMRLCIYTLQAEGIPPAFIKKENFYFSAVKKRDVAPDDNADHQVTIQLKNGSFSFVVHHPDSILKAAKKQSVHLPYSCETGRCGSCVALCSKGKVWHSYNEVLTEKELTQGLVLTCVGHPDKSDLVLEIR
jgi:ring-1,2-phenylacetyl-CoA epoxidase subunit PaaE